MSKTRIDSWASALTEEQAWELFYKARRCPWFEAAAWAVKEYGLERAPSRTSFYQWLAAMRSEEHEHRMGEAAIAAAEAAALGKKATKDEALIAAFKAVATEAALKTDAKTALSFIHAAVSLQDNLNRGRELARKDEELHLAREKFEAAEKRLAAAASVTADPALSDEQRVGKIKEIFGIQSLGRGGVPPPPAQSV